MTPLKRATQKVPAFLFYKRSLSSKNRSYALQTTVLSKGTPVTTEGRKIPERNIG